jgi:hypothetical protein
MHPEKDRRSYSQSDADRRQQEDIERLIADEEDTKVRLQLMILNKINLALIANTNVTNSIRNDLDQHLEIFATRTREQDALLNKGRGAWWIVSSGLVLAQVVFGSLWITIRDDMKAIRTDISSVSIEQAKRSSRLENLEHNVGLIIQGRIGK